MKHNFELVRFKVIGSSFRVANTAPIVTNFVNQIKVLANESKTIDVADLADAENSDTLAIE